MTRHISVLNLDLGWRSCKGCSLSLDRSAISPALFLSEEWHSGRFHRACSQEGKVLHRGVRANVDVRCACCALSTLWSQRQESRSQGGEPRAFPSICSAHLHPILGCLGRGQDFPRSKGCFTTKVLHHRELGTPQKNKSEFVIFSCTILKNL